MKKRYRNAIETVVLFTSLLAVAMPVQADLPTPTQERRQEARDRQAEQQQDQRRQTQLRQDIETLRRLESQLNQPWRYGPENTRLLKQIQNLVSRITTAQVEEANKWLGQLRRTNPQLSKELLQTITEAEAANKRLLEQMKKEIAFGVPTVTEENSSEVLLAGKNSHWGPSGIADFAVFGFVALAFVCWRRIANSSKNTSPSNDHV